MPQADGLIATAEVQQSAPYAALRNLLTPGAAKQDVVSRFCGLVESASSVEDTEEQLYLTWKAVIAKAAETSYQDNRQSPLAALLVALTSRDRDAKGQDLKLWQDLPIFGQQVRDAWNFAAEDNSSAEQKERWININAFLATLVDQLHDKNHDHPDFSLYCIWTVRDALEGDEEAISDTALAAAAVWFKLASGAILDFCKKEKSFEGKLASGGFLYKHKGWTGFSLERWQAWKQRLRNIQGKIQVEKAKQLTGDAITAMDVATGES